MKTLSKVLALVLAVAMLAAFTAACGDNKNGGSDGGSASKDILAGSWKQTDEVNGDWVWTFDGAGKCTLEGITTGFSGEGTYKLDENAKTVTVEMEAWDDVKEYSYTLEGDNLNLDSTYSTYKLVRQ